MCHTSDHSCALDPIGDFSSLTDCQIACTPRYVCLITKKQCVADRLGDYTDLTACQASCHEPARAAPK